MCGVDDEAQLLAEWGFMCLRMEETIAEIVAAAKAEAQTGREISLGEKRSFDKRINVLTSFSRSADKVEL